VPNITRKTIFFKASACTGFEAPKPEFNHNLKKRNTKLVKNIGQRQYKDKTSKLSFIKWNHFIVLRLLNEVLQAKLSIPHILARAIIPLMN